MSLEELADRLAIHDVQVEYASALDSNEFDRLDDVFLPDGVADYEGIGPCDGVEAIKEVCSGALGPLTGSHHFLGNHWARIDGDTADAGCKFTAQHVLADTPGGDNFIIAGTYTDKMVRTPAGWRIKHRTLAAVWTEGNVDVTQGAAAGYETD